MSPALVFDCDGVLADTERDGHLPAFNATFAEFGLPVRWSVEEYGRLLAIGGGKERLATLFTPENVERYGLPAAPEEQRELVARWHKAKTARYTAFIGSGVLPARPGIARVAAEADDAGWQLAVASTSAEASVRAVLEHAVGAALGERFEVFAGDVVPRKKPAPDIYLLALPVGVRRQAVALDVLGREQRRQPLLAAADRQQPPVLRDAPVDRQAELVERRVEGRQVAVALGVRQDAVAVEDERRAHRPAPAASAPCA